MENKMGRACNIHDREMKCIWIIVGEPEGKVSHGRPTREFEYKVKTDLKEWVHVAHDRGKWRVLLNVEVSP
jgi:hypothetical protein